MEINHQSIREPVRDLTVGKYHLTLLPRRPYEVRYTTETPVIGFAYETQYGTHSFASDKHTNFSARPNSFAYLPSGIDVYSLSPIGGEYLRIKINTENVRSEYLKERYNNRIQFSVISAFESVRRALLSVSSPDILELEDLILRIENLVLQDFLPSNLSCYLTPWRFKVINEIIESRLGSKLTVQILADSLGLSAGFFSRAFKASVGKSPYSYILDRRIYLARALLKDKNFGLSDVALSAGFSSHAHMTAAFMKKLGVSPTGLLS